MIATRFDDGHEKHIDISQWFRGPVFKPLKDAKFLQEVFCRCGNSCVAEWRRHRSGSSLRSERCQEERGEINARQEKLSYLESRYFLIPPNVSRQPTSQAA